MSDKYYGKYRAIVTNNKDPDKMGRIKVKCPSLLDEYESAWCMPCFPFLYNTHGIFNIPKINDVVWVEFEGGDLDNPIWVGGWFNPSKAPLKDYEKLEDTIVVRTRGGLQVTLDDKDQAIKLLHEPSGATLEIDKAGKLKVLASKVEFNRL